MEEIENNTSALGEEERHRETAKIVELANSRIEGLKNRYGPNSDEVKTEEAQLKAIIERTKGEARGIYSISQRELNALKIDMNSIKNKEINDFSQVINSTKDFNTLKPTEKQFLFENLKALLPNIPTENKSFIIGVLTYVGKEKNIQNIQNIDIYRLLPQYFKNDFEVIEATLNGENNRLDLINGQDKITQMLPKEFFKKEGNSIRLLSMLHRLGYETGKITTEIIEASSSNIKTKINLYKQSFEVIKDRVQIRTILHDINDEEYKVLTSGKERETTAKYISENDFGDIERNRQFNATKFTQTLNALSKGELIGTEDLIFINTQIYKFGGIQQNKQTLKLILAKNPGYLVDLTSIQGDKELAMLCIKKLKGLFAYVSSDLKNDIDVLKSAFQSQEDYEFLSQFLNGLTNTKTRQQFLEHLKKKHIKFESLDENDSTSYLLTSQNKKVFNRENKLSNETVNGGNLLLKSERTETPIGVKNPNGTYTVFIQGQKIPGLSEAELAQISNEKSRENLVHFFNVLRSCGLGRIWRQRESIFKAVSNTKGIAFDTKNGDYLSRNEITIFLKAIIKSVSGSFENQAEVNTILSSENENDLVSFVKNHNGKDNLTGPARDKFGRTKLVEILFDTYFPDGKFQQSAFEQSLK